MKSKTPRTNSVLLKAVNGEVEHSGMAAMTDHARQIELELNAAFDAIETQREHIAELKSQIAAAMPNDPKLSHGANNRKREFAANLQMKEQPPLAPARC